MELMLEHAPEVVSQRVMVVDALHDDVLEALKLESEKRRRATKVVRSIAVGMVVFLAAFEFWHFLRTGKLDMGFLVPAMIVTSGISIGADKSLAAAIRSAAPLRDPESFSAMVDVLSAGNPELKAIAVECLVEMMPHVTQHHFDQLDAEQRALLDGLLATTTQPGVAEAIGALLSRCGGKSAVPVLEAFCNGKTALKGASRDRALGNVRLHLADLRIELARARIEAGP